MNLGWNHVFEGLPKYDANQQPYKYSVQEQAIAGYTARVYDMSMLSADSGLTFVIENTLVLGKPGEITVTKKVTGDKQPPADTPFKFELQIEVYRPAGTNALFAASALADLTLDQAANNVNDAISSLRAESILTTGSQYEYLLTERENEFADAMAVMAMDATSPSAIIFDTDEQFAVTQPENEEYEMKANLLDTIIDLLNDLSIERAQDLTNETMEEVLVDIFEKLAEQLELPEGCTMALDKETVENLIVAAVAYDNTLNSYEEENQPIETTTPSALQLFMNGKAVTPSALIFVETETDGYYKYEFELLDGKSAIFGVQATTGSAIRYNIVERLTDATSGENYVGTEILFGTDGKVDGVTLGWTDFEESQVMGYTVVNNYANNPYIPPVDPVDPVDPGKTDDPTDPDIEIEDPDVPLAEPEEPVIEIEDPDVPLIDVPGEEVEIDEPEVPLGDAPQTGDNSNTIPFVVLMLAAACGLAVTRRKFN